MKIGITKLLPENIALPDVKNLAIFEGNVKVGTVDVSKMRLPELGTKLYSFGLLSDIHISPWDSGLNANKFDSALNFFEGQGCNFVCISGDLTSTGIYLYEDDNTVDTVNWYDDGQFAEYKRIRELHPNLPVYGMCGNHEGYVKPITLNLDEMEYFVGYELAYTVKKDNDLFIFIGQSDENAPMSKEHFEWLSATLEANKNKRCFVFIHPYVDADDSGNPSRLHASPLFDYMEVDKHGYSKSTFIDLIASYPNVILFHGHSHMRFENQESVENANYSTAFGFKSVHVPSTAYCRDIRSGTRVNVDIAQGYIADVYANHVVLKGYDFTANKFVPIAQYCIDTTL